MSRAGESAYYLCTNRNKRSVAIDFATREGAEIVRNLARRADVLIENFRPGSLSRYGLDHKSLRAINPRLIYCSITAFGQTGPSSGKPGYDFAVQAAGGLMSISGQPEGTPGAEPMKTGVAVTDLFTGVYATVGILAALQARSVSGLGQFVDMALFDTQVAMLANQASNFLISGAVPQRMGNRHPNVVPYQVFATRDGHLVLAVGNDEQFRRCCLSLGRPDLSADPRYTTNSSRLRNRDALVGAIAETLKSRSTREWLNVLEAADVPCAPINRIDEVFEDAQALARGLKIVVDHPYGALHLVASPLRLSETPVAYRLPPPLLGEHTDQVLADELQIDAQSIVHLKTLGVVR